MQLAEASARGRDITDKKSRRFRFVHLFLLVPYIALLWVGSYDRLAPALMGIPFFYWYQLLWIPLGALLLYGVYRTLERRED